MLVEPLVESAETHDLPVETVRALLIHAGTKRDVFTVREAGAKSAAWLARGKTIRDLGAYWNGP